MRFGSIWVGIAVLAVFCSALVGNIENFDALSHNLPNVTSSFVGSCSSQKWRDGMSKVGDGTNNQEGNFSSQNLEPILEGKSEVPENAETAIIEYKEVDEPCVALTIIGENRLTDAAVFVKRSFRFSVKAFFSTIVLTIMNLFI